MALVVAGVVDIIAVGDAIVVVPPIMPLEPATIVADELVADVPGVPPDVVTVPVAASAVPVFAAAAAAVAAAASAALAALAAAAAEEAALAGSDALSAAADAAWPDGWIEADDMPSVPPPPPPQAASKALEARRPANAPLGDVAKWEIRCFMVGELSMVPST